jgi:hypothetical protein
MRSIMMTSASATASSTLADTRTPKCSMPDVRTQHAAVQQVADDRDLEPLDPLLVLADRERVEQRLRRMLVHAVAGVDDARLANAGQQVAGAR